MKHLILCAAVLSLAASGCARLACRDCEQAGHVTRSQRAPRPIIVRTTGPTAGTGLLCGKNGCEDGCTDCDENWSESCDSDAAYCASGSGACGPNDSCDGQSGCGLCGRLGCGGGGLCPHSGGYPEPVLFNPGPPVGQVAYPYYTVRGPRDFLQNNPPSIGPY